MDPVDLKFGRPGTTPDELPPPIVSSVTSMADGPSGVSCLTLPCSDDLALPLAVQIAIDRLAQSADLGTRKTPEIGDRCVVEPLPEVWVLESGPMQIESSALPAGRYYRLKSGEQVHLLEEAEFFRLARTENDRPLASRRTKLNRWKATPLERLLQRRMANDAARNSCQVILVAPKTRTVDDLEDLRISHPRVGEVPLVKLCSWGEFDNEARPRALHGLPDSSVPNVLITHSIEIAASWLERHRDPTTPAIVLDGAAELVRSPHTLAVLEDAHTIVLSEFTDSSQHERLREMGVAVRGVIPTRDRRRGGLFDGFWDAAANASNFRVGLVEASDDTLEAVVQALRTSEEGEQTDETESIRGRLFQIVLALAEWPGGPSQHALDRLRGRLQEMRQELRRGARWMSEETASHLTDAVRSLTRVGEGEVSIGADKLRAIRQTWAASQGRLVLCTRSPHVAAAIHERTELGLEVGHFGAIPSGVNHLVVTSFPGRKRVGPLMATFPAATVTFVVYPFESEWLRIWAERAHRGFQRLLSSGSTAPEVATDRLWTDRFGLPKPPDWPRQEPEIARAGEGHPSMRTEGEEIAEARLVSFYGGYYAYLTENYKAPVVRSANGTQILQLRPRKLSSDDVTLFREGGDRDVIRMLAEDGVGRAEYSRLRDVAEEWKSALFKVSRSSEEVRRRLAEAGLDVPHLVTIRQWMFGDTIGPRDPDALLNALRALGVTTDSGPSEVIDAIRRIRSEHRTAGHRLTDLLMEEVPSRLTGLEESGTAIDLSIGRVLVMVVASASNELELRGIGEVTRLFLDGEEVMA